MGIGSSKKLKVAYEKPRDYEDATDNYKKWMECLTFEDLKERGREAFLKYAEEHQGNNAKRRLEFWFKSPDDGQLGNFLTDFLMDEPLPDVGALTRNKIVARTVVERASQVEDAIKVMKDSMRSDCNEYFKEFQKYLKEKYKETG